MKNENDGMEKFHQEYEMERQRYEKEQQRKRDERITQTNNIVAYIIRIIGFIVLGISIIVSMANSQNDVGGDNFWLLGCGACLSCIALSEVIQILHDIRAKVYKK